MASKAELDVIVFGGGISGLWTLAKLREAGYRALLLESDTLGTGQTRSAQGIIHSGLKYQLGRSRGMPDTAGIPALWAQHMRGELTPDLSQVPQLSDAQYLWARGFVDGQIVSRLARRAMAGAVVPVAEADRPELFQQAGFNGKVFRVAEPVLDTVGLLQALAAPLRDSILKVNWPTGVEIVAGKRPRVEIRHQQHDVTLLAKRLVFAAGSGNQDLLKFTRRKSHGSLRRELRVDMQTRPLHMLMARGELPGDIYAHCIGRGSLPRITVTSHRDQSGEVVWYMGGAIAEGGIADTPERHIHESYSAVAKVMPWVDFSDVEWASFHVDRAEPYQTSGGRPKSFYVNDAAGVITAWPTKMVLAPLMVEKILKTLTDADIQPSEGPASRAELGLEAFGQPPAVAARPWDTPRQWR